MAKAEQTKGEMCEAEQMEWECEAMEQSRACCVVTGGRGFAARHLVKMLIQSGRWTVRIADLATSITLDEVEENGTLGDALRSGHAVYFSADLRDKSQVIEVCKGASVVFHMAAPDSSINNFNLQYSVTVQGTQNVISACLECKVKKLVYTSSPSVVFDGIHGIYNGDESLPYPDKHNDSYSQTKSEAEALVLRSNGKEGLLTCAIRPSSIFGPGDKLLVPSVVAAARAGKSKFIIGDGENMYDFTYVENVAHAHMCAEQALNSNAVDGKDSAAGKAFFITNMEPIRFWEFMSLILEGLGYQRPRIHIPVKVVMPIAHMVEWTYRKLAPYGMPVPQLTPSRIRLLSCSRTFNCSRAQKLLGYAPVVPLEQGIKLTVESYSHLRAEVPAVVKRSFDSPSKAYKMLRNEKVANILLWRDEKKTAAILLTIFILFYFFFASGYCLMSVVAKLLLLVTTVLFFYSCLPYSMFGYTIRQIPSSCFQIHEGNVQSAVLCVTSAWNSGLTTLKILSQGKDWALFFKTMGVLLFLKFLGAFAFPTLVGLGLIFMFSVFYIYEQKEEEVDELVKAITVLCLKVKGIMLGKVQGNRKSS
uniref:Reticulon-like protein n=1 Tax=Araucaria cunninghamii TaxID=56994 RepID=A0A0D6R0R5_ARACU